MLKTGGRNGCRPAETNAEALFAAVADRGLVAPGAGEREVRDRIRDLANEMFGTPPFTLPSWIRF